jgi:hypothetical protein
VGPDLGRCRGHNTIYGSVHDRKSCVDSPIQTRESGQPREKQDDCKRKQRQADQDADDAVIPDHGHIPKLDTAASSDCFLNELQLHLVLT